MECGTISFATPTAIRVSLDQGCSFLLAVVSITTNATIIECQLFELSPYCDTQAKVEPVECWVVSWRDFVPLSPVIAKMSDAMLARYELDTRS
eukprot:scaffold6568_cov57-Attheya_sp.AAC.3